MKTLNNFKDKKSNVNANKIVNSTIFLLKIGQTRLAECSRSVTTYEFCIVPLASLADRCTGN